MSEPTDRRTVAQQLAKVDDARALLEGLFFNSPMAYQIYRADGVSMLVNPAFMAMYGAAPPPEYNVFKDEILERNGFLGLVRRAFAGETIRIPPTWYDPREHRGIDTEGARRVAIDVTLFPLRDAAGVVRHVAVCAKDITAQFELQAATEELRLREQELAATLDSIGDGVIATDVEGRVVRINGVAEALTGWKRGEALGRPLEEIFPIFNQETGEPVENPVARVLRTGAIVGLANHTVLVSRDGARRAIADSGAPIRGAGGRVQGVVLVFRDVTAEYAAERERNLREARLRLAFDAASILSWDIDMISGRMLVSDNMPQVLGLPPGMRLDTLQDALKLVHPDDVGELAANLEAAKNGAPLAEACFRVISPTTRKVMWFERRSRVEKDASGTPWLRGIVIDVTERVAAEEALRVSEARYRTSFEAAPEAIVTLDVDAGHFVEANQHAERLLGYTREQLLTMNPFDVSPAIQPDGRVSAEFGREVITRALAGEQQVFEWMHRHSSGREVPCEIRLVRLPGGRNLCRGSMIDISERKRAEAERARLEAALHRAEENLRQSQKMEAIGRLAGGVAHDFNNLLSVILGYCDILLADLGPDAPMRPDLESVRRSGQQAADLTRQLLAFSRQQVLALRVLDLNDVVRNADKMLRRLLGEDIDLSAACCAGAARVRVDPGQIDQVIMNLAINARDAMPRGGKLTLETSRVTLDDEYAAANPGVSPGPHVVLSVSDTGVGIAPEVQPRIFEPFFTTKDRGKGTGLGLSTVFGIVQQSGGHVTVYSEPGSGTTFRIYLPESEEAVAPTAPPLEPATLSGTETILLVEDQEEVRQVAQEILRRHGYTVLAAADVEEAIRLCAQPAPPIALLLTDVVMPRMSGPELAKRLVELRPEMKVIFMSGYTEQAVVRHGVLDAAAAYLPKPLVPAVLARRVREVLDGTST
jgi:PAS domain S-box-containing protein